MRWTVAAVVSAILAASSPIVVSTLGTEVPWTVALAWAAIAASAKKRWHVQTCAAALALLTHFGWAMFLFAALMLAFQWGKRGRFPLRAGLVLAIVASAGGLMAAEQVVGPFSPLHLSLPEWKHGIQQLLGESEFYWLFLPLVGLGLLTAVREFWVFGLAWIGVLAVTGSATAKAMTITLALFLAGLGIEWLIRRIEASNVVRLDRLALATSVALLLGLPLGVAQSSSLLLRYQLRPIIRQELERQAGEWLRVHSAPGATIFASERVGYLADRTALVWGGVNGDGDKSRALVRALAKDPPEYCVSLNSIAWGRLMRTSWFQDNYEQLETFESPYDAASPFTIWGYRHSVFDAGKYHPTSARLSSGANLVGYRYWPERVMPGEAVYVTLFWQSSHPIGDSFRPVVQVVSPSDGMAWAQVNDVTHRSVLKDWQQTEQVVTDRFVLTTTTGIPVGAYDLRVSTRTPDLKNVLPFYHGQDTSPTSRILLGYLVVPWRGEMDQAKPVNARVGERINLLGFEVEEGLSPGAEFDVTLYWEAQSSPEDDYVVFVHLLDSKGQLAAGHDGPPMSGWYHTKAWLPGEVVPDTHHLVLEPDLPTGTYWLQVGMYRWPSLERLPAWDSQGVEQVDGAIVLQPVEVR
jgi:hypothetical protein